MTLKLYLMLLLLWPSQEQERPLPDLTSFLADFRKTLHSDDKLLSQYTYTEKETGTKLDSKGNAKESEVNVYQVIHADEDWKTYRRRIVKNGVPLTDKELEKQDREEKERVGKETQKREKQSPTKRQAEKDKEDREERETLDDVFAMYDVQLVGREVRSGASTIAITFKPKPNYKPKTSDGKDLQHIAGRVWIAEDDHELVRLEGEIIDPISIGAGLLAKLNKGSTFAFERRKINGEIWLPVKVDILINGRLLLLKGLNMREVIEYSEHKKYTVDTILKFPDPQTQPDPQ